MPFEPRPRFPGTLVFAAGALFAGLSVVTGAFGAHALKPSLTPDDLGVYETAVRYQMYHGLALLFVGRMLTRRPTRLLWAVCALFIGGILLFSGSLYLLAVTGNRAMGAITPLGGVAFIAGWAGLALESIRSSRR